MRLEIDIAEHHYNNIMALDSVSLGRVPYKGIIMYSINAIKHGKVLEQESNSSENPTSSTTKNDLGVDAVSRQHEGEDIPIYDTDVESIKTAVSIMRKCQKIEQIIDEYDLEAWEVLEMIKRVIEDGKID